MKIEIEINDDSPFIQAISKSIEASEASKEDDDSELSGEIGLKITCLVISCLEEQK